MGNSRGGNWVVAQLFLLSLHFLMPLFWRGPLAWDAWFEGPTRWIALPIGLWGAFLCLGGATRLGKNLTPFPKPLAEGELVDRGVYALVRHPIYGGLIALALSWALVTNAPMPLLSAAVIALFFDRKAAREEQWLMEKYADYGEYRSRVRKFAPWIF